MSKSIRIGKKMATLKVMRSKNILHVQNIKIVDEEVLAREVSEMPPSQNRILLLMLSNRLESFKTSAPVLT